MERPHLTKVAHFDRIYPRQIENNEWRVRWPIEHRYGKTYNPDYYEPATDLFIEVCTSPQNFSQEREKWAKAIAIGYRLVVYWWTGHEITDLVLNPPTYAWFKREFAPRIDL